MGAAARRRAELMGWSNVASMISGEYLALTSGESRAGS